MNEWAEGRVNLKPTTVHGYKVAIRAHIIPGVGNVKLQDLTTTRLNRLYKDLHTPSDPERRPLSARSVELCHAVLRKALNDAVRTGELKSNPAQHATLPRKEKPQLTPPWTAEQMGVFLSSIEQHPLRAAFVLLGGIGARRGEIAALRWKHVDLESGQIRIEGSRTTISGQVVEGPQEQDERSHHWPRRDHRRHSSAASRQASQGAHGEGAGCHLTRRLRPQEADGSGVHPNRMSRAFKSASKAAQLPDVRLHDLRHSFATIAL